MGTESPASPPTVQPEVHNENRVLTFLHLSDIHFRHRAGSSTQFDLEAQLRKPFLDDIISKPANGAAYDGLFITGDIAFGGKKEEYEKAKGWLEEIYSKAGVLPERTYVIPGNHDVNRAMVPPKGAIWNNHAVLRAESNKVVRREILQTQLSKDPACDPLGPLEQYNEFAQRYNCRTAKDKLAWVEIFPLCLSDGSILRINGLNSAINSDEDDDVGKLYVAPFQTQHFSRDAGVTDLVLCHHPPHWMLDMMEIDGALKSYARVALFGHEHNHRTQRVDNTVQLFAGAVHPAARDPDWLPTYHILQLSIEGTGKNRKLTVRIFSRELRALEHSFVARMATDNRPFEERIVDLTEWQRPTRIPVAISAESNVYCQQNAMTSEKVQTDETTTSPAFRELIVYFHRLSTPVRYKISTDLNLLLDGDDVPPQQQWDLVFKRAREGNRLGELWDAVAKYDTVFASRGNPFKTK